jgi:hypothetical protein
MLKLKVEGTMTYSLSRRLFIKKVSLNAMVIGAGGVSLLLAACGGGDNTTMDPLADNIVRVVDKWCDLETGPFNRGTAFEGLWVRRYQLTKPYDPVGIDELKDRLQNDAFFRDKQPIRDLGRGHFAAGGVIQTEGDLYDYVKS